MISDEEIVRLTAEYVKKELFADSSGHDWWHVYRVWNVAREIAKIEGADTLIVELAALLHDISDYKLNGGNDAAAEAIARSWLFDHGVAMPIVDAVSKIIKDMGFKTIRENPNLESAIVRDADYLDAMGAIGIARAFAFGGYKGQPIHQPGTPPKKYQNREEYKRRSGSTINHFHEKLLHLKDAMQTQTAKHVAKLRHRILTEYLSEFEREWNADDVTLALPSESDSEKNITRAKPT